MTNESNMELTNKQRKTLLRLYSGIVELQASVLYYISEEPDNAHKIARAEQVMDAMMTFRKKALGDDCPSGTVPCGNGDCRPPGGCGPSALHKRDPKGGNDG